MRNTPRLLNRLAQTHGKPYPGGVCLPAPRRADSYGAVAPFHGPVKVRELKGSRTSDRGEERTWKAGESESRVYRRIRSGGVKGFRPCVRAVFSAGAAASGGYQRD